MNSTACCLLVAPWLFIAPQREVAPRFAPRPGARVAKQFDLEVELRDAAIEIDGQAFWSLGPKTIRLLTSSKFTDTYVKTEAGRPLDLLRSFGEISGKWEADGVRTDIVGFYALSGCAVRFVWDPKRGDYSRTLEVGKVRDLHEEQLVEDLDLRGFLPEEPAQPGEKWIAHGRPVVDALFGSTEMGLLGMPKEQELEVLIRDVLLRPFRELGDRRLEIACVLAGSDDTLEPDEMEIKLQLFDRFDVNATEAVNDFFLAMARSSPPMLKVDFAGTEWNVDGRGKLVWNVAENRLVAFDLDARVHLECVLEIPWGRGGERSARHVRLRSEGDIKWTVRAQEPR